jgi:transposase
MNDKTPDERPDFDLPPPDFGGLDDGQKPTVGRRSKLTPELQAEFVELIRSGQFQYTVCAYVGITYDTFRRWMRRGEKELQRLSRGGRRAKAGEKEQPYAGFYLAVTQARAEAEVRNVVHLNKSSDWRARAFWLERSFPKRWGKRDKLEVDGKLSTEAQVVIVLPDNGRGAGGSEGGER